MGECEGNVEGSYPNCETEQAGCSMINPDGSMETYTYI